MKEPWGVCALNSHLETRLANKTTQFRLFTCCFRTAVSMSVHASSSKQYDISRTQSRIPFFTFPEQAAASGAIISPGQADMDQ